MAGMKYFGTDGIRGEANSKDMNAELALAVGRAAAYFARGSEELPSIVVGKDTRISCYMLESAICSGITSMGVNALRTGPLPTPGIAFLCKSMRARLGIVISASHNPADQNGIKLFCEDGFKLSPVQEAEIERIMDKREYERAYSKPLKVGKITQIDDAYGRYVQYLKERFPGGLTLKGLKIAVDASNGAAYRVAPTVLSELGAEIVTMGCSPNGLNINEGCGVLDPKCICDMVQRTGVDVGITLDGDADRVLMVDENGRLIDGDVILYILAKHLYSRGNLNKNTVVGTVMTNYALDSAFRELGLNLVRTEVGDHNVIRYMRDNQLELGGEPSGHIVYLHNSSTGDGVMAALKVLSVMQQQKKRLGELAAGYRPFPQRTVNVRVREKKDLDKMPQISNLKKEIEKKLEGKGRVILRYSGTEMLARVTVESDNEELTKELVEKLANAVKESIGSRS